MSCISPSLSTPFSLACRATRGRTLFTVGTLAVFSLRIAAFSSTIDCLLCAAAAAAAAAWQWSRAPLFLSLFLSLSARQNKASKGGREGGGHVDEEKRR